MIAVVMSVDQLRERFPSGCLLCRGNESLRLKRKSQSIERH
jgi:hypothetical protein